MHVAQATVPHIPFEQTAAGRLTPRVPVLKSGSTLADLQTLLWKSVQTFDTVRDTFVIDDKHHLLGTVASRTVFDKPLPTKVDDVMIPYDAVVKVLDTDDQELAVQAALHHAVESVAVVDHHRKFKGAISIKELMKILQQETQEDLAAEGKYDMSPKLDSILEVSLVESFKSRAPWILIGVGGGTVVAFILGFFEELLATHIELVAFIPLIVYIVGAVSAPLQMLYVRDSAIYPTLPFWRYFMRQGLTVLVISVALSVALYILGLVYGLGSESLVVAFGTGVAMLSAILTGVLVPLGLSRVVRDPANATAPIATILSDATTIVVFFSIASVLLT